MRASQASSTSTTFYLREFKITPDGPSFTGPGRYDATMRGVYPHGFGQIHQTSKTVTWGEVKTVLRLPNRFEVIFCGLRYDIFSSDLPDDRCQTDLQMITHSQDGVILDKLTLMYQYPRGRWDLANLIRCEIAQPDYTKTKAGCILFNCLRDPIQSFERDFFFRKNKHCLISFNQELYFAHRRFRTLKKIIRHDNNALEYDFLLKEFADLVTKKPGKAEVNQGYFNPVEASARVLMDISKLTGFSLEDCSLEDGEGLIYAAHKDMENEFQLITGYVDFCSNPEYFPMRDYKIFWGNQAESFFYKGQGLLVSDNKVILHGQGMFCQKNRQYSRTQVILHQGAFLTNVRSGTGNELTFYQDTVLDVSSLQFREERRCFLERGSWIMDQKEGEFTHIEYNKTAHGLVYAADQRMPLPYLLKTGNEIIIVAYAEGAKTDNVSYYYIGLSPNNPPTFVKVVAVDAQQLERMTLIEFLEAINLCPNNQLFQSLLLKHASFSDLSFFQFQLRLAGYPDLANQFFSSLCGSFPTPEGCSPFLYDTRDIPNRSLWTYFEKIVGYLASLGDNSNLYRGVLRIKEFYADPTFQDYASILSHFSELDTSWTQLLSQKKTISHQQKRSDFESLLLELAFPWIFHRVFMIYSSILQLKAIQLKLLTKEEQTISEMFHLMHQDTLMAKTKRVCEEFYDLEKTLRATIMDIEETSFGYFADMVCFSRACVEARASLYLEVWNHVLDQLKKQEFHDRLELQNEQRLSQTAMKPAIKRWYVMREFYADACRKRNEITAHEMFDWNEILQAVKSAFEQMEQRCIADESIYRTQVFDEFLLSFKKIMHESACLKSQLVLFDDENKRFNQIKIHSQLSYIIQYVRQISFDRPFDVYIVGSAVANKILGQDWRPDQDIDVMILAKAPGEFLQISEENAHRHGLRQSQHIFGLYTSVMYVPGLGRRRVDLKVSDCLPIYDFNWRDFTVGALYEDGSSETLDPSCRGLIDLRTKQLNTVRPAAESFHSSPVQIFRAIKYHMNGYTLSQDIIDSMKNWSSQLTTEQYGHVCAVVRNHLGCLNNKNYVQLLISYGLTQSFFGISPDLSLEDTLRGINRCVFPQSTSGFFYQNDNRITTNNVPRPSFFSGRD